MATKTTSSIKTKVNEKDVTEFINEFANTDQKKADSFELIRLMQSVTGCEPKMWGPSIIGFGVYHYKSDRSRQEGDWPMLGFSPRKAAISLYVHTGTTQQKPLLEGLGKFKIGKACIYINKLSDINQEKLVVLMKDSIQYLQSKYG
ncbi:MAG: DUF1801 domain-containing protein [Ferruginibacter sp.]